MTAYPRQHAGPAVGDSVHLKHDASGSVLIGRVRMCPSVGLVVDVDGRIFDLDRDGWHVETVFEEPPAGSVVLDGDGDAWQRFEHMWHPAMPLVPAYTWAELVSICKVREIVWTPAVAA